MHAKLERLCGSTSARAPVGEHYLRAHRAHVASSQREGQGLSVLQESAVRTHVRCFILQPILSALKWPAAHCKSLRLRLRSAQKVFSPQAAGEQTSSSDLHLALGQQETRDVEDDVFCVLGRHSVNLYCSRSGKTCLLRSQFVARWLYNLIAFATHIQVETC